MPLKEVDEEPRMAEACLMCECHSDILQPITPS